MFEFMDEIVEGIEQIAEVIKEGIVYIIVLTLKAVILITTPVWIIPYKMLKDKKGKKD